MDVNTQIRRGVERCIASNESARLEGLYGLDGLSEVDNFDGLEGLLEESGFSGARQHVQLLRRQADNVSGNMIRAVPVAKRAMELMDEHDGDLSGIFSKVKKGLKKVVKGVAKVGKKIAKVAVKSPLHKLIAKTPLKKISATHKIAAGKSALTEAAIGPPKVKDPEVRAQMAANKAAAKAEKKRLAAEKKAAKAAAKQAKKDAKAAAALARAGVQPGTPTVEAGAQVLANQSGANFSSDQAAELARQVAANIAQPGSTAPSASLFNPGGGEPMPEAAPAEGGGLLSNPWVLGGGVALLAGAVYLATRKKGR
jgi:hypothetical protein